MEKQQITVTIPASALKAEDFGLDAEGNLKLDKSLLNKLVRENINAKVSPDDRVAVSVGVVVGT